MNRRTFLKAFAASWAAALAAPSVSMLPGVPPTIDWTVWNQVELKAIDGTLVDVRINDTSVMAYPDLVRKVAQMMHVSPDGVRFTALWPEDGQSVAPYSGFLLDLKDDMPEHLVVGFTVKQTALGGGILSDPVVNDALLDGTCGGALVATGQHGVRIELLIPESTKEA